MRDDDRDDGLHRNCDPIRPKTRRGRRTAKYPNDDTACDRGEGGVIWTTNSIQVTAGSHRRQGVTLGIKCSTAGLDGVQTLARPAICSSERVLTTFPGDPMTMLLSGMVLFSGMRVLAPMRQFLPTLVLFRIMLPIPIKDPSPISHPWSITWQQAGVIAHCVCVLFSVAVGEWDLGGRCGVKG